MPSGIFSLKQQNLANEVGAWSNQKTPAVEYLVVAGGGAGGGGYGSGGGAGGMLAGSYYVTPGSAITVTIGAGGAGVGGAGGNNGAASVFGNISSAGGGAGLSGYGNRANSGGSGGGGGGNTSSRTWGQGTFGQGNRGGNATDGTGPGQGGGGGAGTAGGDGTGDRPAGYGGNGLGTYIGGALAVYGGGGGGGVYNGSLTTDSGLGGTGGGGAGGTGNTSANGTAGTANTGGGGGGSSYSSGVGGSPAGGNGGSGIVVISYPDVYQAAASTTGSPTVSTSGAGSIYFNSASSQALIFNSNSAFQLGTGDFTWESWINYNKTDVGFFDLGAINGAGSFGVFAQGSTLFVRIDGSSNDLTYSMPGGYTNNWIHIAVVRSGTTLTLYYNGTAVASGTRINNITQSTPYIGVLNGLSAFYLLGYVSNLRLVKGSAVYTSNFTPSTAPLRSVSGTSLLLNCNSGATFADASGNGFVPASGSSGSWNQLSPFATGLGYKNRVYTWTSSGSITF
jgi:hypothetical protein